MWRRRRAWPMSPTRPRSTRGETCRVAPPTRASTLQARPRPRGPRCAPCRPSRAAPRVREEDGGPRRERKMLGRDAVRRDAVACDRRNHLLSVLRWTRHVLNVVTRPDEAGAGDGHIPRPLARDTVNWTEPHTASGEIQPGAGGNDTRRARAARSFEDVWRKRPAAREELLKEGPRHFVCDDRRPTCRPEAHALHMRPGKVGHDEHHGAYP